MEINSKHYSELYKEELKDRIKRLNIVPSLTIIVAKDYSAPSKIYVGNKIKVATELGIDTNLIEIEWEDKTKEELMEELKEYIYTCFKSGSAIVIQDPFPQMSQREIAFLLEEYYILDVDGFSNVQKHYLFNSDKRTLAPATAKGIIKLLKYVHGEELNGCSISIFSRSSLIGSPLLQLALQENMTPTVLHSKSEGYDKCKAFTNDIIVTGIGKRKYFNSDNIMNPKATIIDCSMHKEEGINGVGDCDKEDILSSFPDINIASGFGHTGVFTVLALMDNVIKVFELMEGKLND